MSRVVFRERSDFSSAHDFPYSFLPFRFLDFEGRKLLTNEVGEHLILDGQSFSLFTSGQLSRESPEYEDLKAKHFLSDSASTLPVEMLATKYRTKRNFLSGFTRLHIFVVTLRCDHSCHYCQVSRVSPDRLQFDMSVEAANRSLDLVFRSPAPSLTLEFQGGEPLLNFELIVHVVQEAKRRNALANKALQFVITTNLALLTDDILEFCRANDVLISTSLDGPEFIHNANRPRPGANSHELAVRGIQRAREALGQDRVAALMTTSKLSLDHPEAIVDEYLRQGFDQIVLRPISPYGFALRTQHKTGYETDRYLRFYERALEHIVELNRQGTLMSEGFAQLLLTKILTPFATGYVDLQSPAGAGISAVVYNYDGDVYVSDEARMLAQTGDQAFRMGSVHHDSYETLFGGELLRTLVTASCVEALPGCSDCALHTFCGSDPVENYATQGSIFGHQPTSNFCKRNMHIIKLLLKMLHGDDPFVKRLFWSWVTGCSVAPLPFSPVSS